MENKKTATAPQFVYFMLIAIGVTIGTGAYVAYPMVMYLLLGAAFFTYCFFLFKKVYKVNVGSNLALLLYVAFLLINYLRDYGNAITDRLYINFFLGICAYLVIVKVFPSGGYDEVPILTLGQSRHYRLGTGAGDERVNWFS